MPSSESLKASISDAVEGYANAKLQEYLTQIIDALPNFGLQHCSDFEKFIKELATGASIELVPTCQGKNKKGKRCCNPAHGETGFCRLHISQHPRFDALTAPQPTAVAKLPVYDEDEDDLRELDVCNTR